MSNRDANDTTGIARFLIALGVDPKTLEVTVIDRDIARGFTTVSFDAGGTAGQLFTVVGPPGAQAGATMHASAQGICYGLVLVNRTNATVGSVTIWEGTASTRKWITMMPAQDVQALVLTPKNPLFKWQPNRTVQIRHTIANPGGRALSITMMYWAEEP